MSEKFISSIHVEKLGHKILEIRERALFNIISKLDHGFVYDNDLARSKEILKKLFEWFLLEPCTNEDVVLKLIKRILQTECGEILLKHLGSTKVQNELQKIRSFIEPKYYPLVDDIFDLVRDRATRNNIVPPLQCDIPLSYRTDQSNTNKINSGNLVESTASTIGGLLQKDSSVEQQTGNIVRSPSIVENAKKDVPANWNFSWQPLVGPDRHVLESVEESLRNPPQPSILLHSCEFFTEVMLQDFPAEVFLQRPAIILQFKELINTCPSTRVTNAVLKSLLKLVRCLKIRVNYYNDPCMHSTKQVCADDTSSQFTSPISPDLRNGSDSRRSNSGDEIESAQESHLLMKTQMPLPKFCFLLTHCVFSYLKPDNLINRKQSTAGTNIAITLLNESFCLLRCCIKSDFFEQSDLTIQQEFDRMVYKFAEVLEYFRLEVAIDDSSHLKRVVQLQLVHICVDFLQALIPLNKSNEILPHNFKSVLCNSLLDVALLQLYPSVPEVFSKYIKEFCGIDNKYGVIKNLCKSMTASVKLLCNYKSLTTSEAIFLAKEAVPSVALHQNLKFIKIFVDVCANKLPMHTVDDKLNNATEEVLVEFLSHQITEIRIETYRLCQKKIIAAIGPKLNVTRSGVAGSQIKFLLSGRILNEILLYGMNDDVLEIQKHSEDILVHVLKCKLLVSDDIWNKTVEALMYCLPGFVCYAGKNSSLGRTVLNVLDPDMAQSFSFSKLEILKGNAGILFTKEGVVRDEAISRLCWLLALQNNSKDFLPKTNNLHDKGLGLVCVLEHLVDINKSRPPQHFYQPSSLQQVLDLLNGPNVEPVIRRSALTQISVMMEDVLLHRYFLDNGGLKTLLKVFKTALAEQDFRDYPDSVIPIISVLKNVCLYNGLVRQELSSDVNLYYWILRSLFLFCTEQRLKQDASILLFLLIFGGSISGSPSSNDFSIDDLLIKNLNVPFKCRNKTRKVTDDLKDVLSDPCALKCIQIHWNVEWYGGFKNIIKWKEVKYDEHDSYDFDKKLRLQNYDLFILKCSSLRYCIKKYLEEVDDGSSHLTVSEAIDKLYSYIFLFNLSNGGQDFTNGDLLSLPWEKTFTRFLNVLPSSENDVILLTHVVRLLCVLAPFYKSSGKTCWISAILKDPTYCLHDLLQFDTNDADYKTLSQELLNLITVCVCQEQHFIDFHVVSHLKLTENRISSWKSLIESIANNLKFSDAQHFYNLAYLDGLLSSLVHLTATLGWMQNKTGISRPEQLQQFISGLCELIGSFHCGKGPSASISMMGLNITRNVMLVLNHLLVEMQTANIKGWEEFFFNGDFNDKNSLTTLCALWSSRDTILRAAVWQLFAGICIKQKGTSELLQKMREVKINIWEKAIVTILDHDEASIVRENASMLLANLTSHTSVINNESPNFDLKKNRNTFEAILSVLNDYNFYKELEVILSCVYTNSTFIFESIQPEETSNFSGFKREWSLIYLKNTKTGTQSSLSSKSSSSEGFVSITTPGFIKAISFFIYNFLSVQPNTIAQLLHENGLIRMFFRSICIPSNEITNTKELALYCDILEMNTAICVLLNKAVNTNNVCLGTVLHTKDCLNVLLSLLDPNLFYTDLPQLLYLRNRLWCAVFNLMASLLECGVFDDEVSMARSNDALSIISGVLNECGQQQFLLTLCEAISSNSSFDLQQSALASLTSLLRIEACSEDNVSETASVQNLLDNIKTPRSATVQSNLGSNYENLHLNPLDNGVDVLWKRNSSNNRGFITQKSPLEEAYFGEKTHTGIVDDKNHGTVPANLMAGAELCKILLHLYDLSVLNKSDCKKKPIIIKALTGILCVSYEAKKYALENGLLQVILKQLRDLHIKLSLESVECLRRVSDKKRICPVLKELNSMIGLLTNFMLGDERIKKSASALGLADLTHKLWIWFCVQNSYMVDALKMLCTYTSDCVEACQSLPLTSAVAGSGPRKVPSNVSLLHAVFDVIAKEMEQISRTHDLTVLQLSFQLLHNTCAALECRILMSKSNLLHCLSHLHPAITKRQKPWESVELMWLEFLQTFSGHPEGQTCITKVPEALEIIMTLTSSQRQANRQAALLVLRNVAFYQPNRARLLMSEDFLNILQTKLSSGNFDEKNMVVTMMWALAANNQKAKLVMKCAQLDVKLQEVLKKYQLVSETNANPKDIERMHFVLNMIRDGEKTR